MKTLSLLLSLMILPSLSQASQFRGAYVTAQTSYTAIMNHMTQMGTQLDGETCVVDSCRGDYRKLSIEKKSETSSLVRLNLTTANNETDQVFLEIDSTTSGETRIMISAHSKIGGSPLKEQVAKNQKISKYDAFADVSGGEDRQYKARIVKPQHLVLLG